MNSNNLDEVLFQEALKQVWYIVGYITEFT